MEKIAPTKTLKYIGKEPTLVRFSAGGPKEIVKNGQTFEADVPTAENLLQLYGYLFELVDPNAPKKEKKIEKVSKKEK